MTRKFEFKNNNLQLDIAGNEFEIDTTNTVLVKRVMKFGEDATVKAAELEAQEDYVEALSELIGFCLDSIDAILGEGSSEKIYKGREVGLFDALDVINFITSEIKEDRDNKFNAYTPNRAERRGK